MSTFMQTKYKDLPNDLQVKILIHHAQSLPPRPQFKKGQVVRYKEQIVAEMRARMPRGCIGPFPYGQLIIWDNPTYSAGEWTYEYEYGYGGTNEGCARECDLVALYI